MLGVEDVHEDVEFTTDDEDESLNHMITFKNKTKSFLQMHKYIAPLVPMKNENIARVNTVKRAGEIYTDPRTGKRMRMVAVEVEEDEIKQEVKDEGVRLKEVDGVIDLIDDDDETSAEKNEVSEVIVID
jgi:hypothetical protein